MPARAARQPCCRPLHRREESAGAKGREKQKGTVLARRAAGERDHASLLGGGHGRRLQGEVAGRGQGCGAACEGSEPALTRRRGAVRV